MSPGKLRCQELENLHHIPPLNNIKKRIEMHHELHQTHITYLLDDTNISHNYTEMQI